MMVFELELMNVVTHCLDADDNISFDLFSREHIQKLGNQVEIEKSMSAHSLHYST